jgi:hypothetical protein
MALYCMQTPLTPTFTLAEGQAFTEAWNPGDAPILAGIYRCSCGGEVVASMAMPLPDDHPHQKSQGPIVWRLTLAAEEPKVIALPIRARPAVRPSGGPRQTAASAGQA